MEPTEKKTGRIRKGWELTKSSWLVLKLDKELAGLPLISGITSVVSVLAIGALVLLVGGFSYSAFMNSVSSSAGGEMNFNLTGWEQIGFGFVLYFVTTVIANFFGAAAIYGATERFRGGDPTLKTSLAGARRKFYPLLLFSFMMSTIGFALQALSERVPFAGQIAVWLVGAAWNIANLFAIPVIVLSDQNIMPFDATRKSVGVIKKVWGESIVVDIAIGVIATIAFLLYLLIGGGVAAVISAMVVSGTIGMSLFISIPLIALGIAGIFGLVLVFSILSSIAKAAIYHYAVTGEAPEHFSKELLRQTMTPKKARKIFA